MSEYKKLAVNSPETISKIGELFTTLQSGIDIIFNAWKGTVELAKLQASGANLALQGLKTSLEGILDEIEKLKGGTMSGILAHPNAYRIRADYDRETDTMTLTPISALQQVQEAFDDDGDPLAPDKVNNYGGLVIVGAVPGIDEFIKTMKAVGGFFSLQELKDLAEQIKERWTEKQSGIKVKTKLSSGLDFFGISQEMFFPHYIALLDRIQAYVESIKSGIISASGSLDDITDFIDKKLAESEEIAEDIKDFLDQFKFELSETGVYYKSFDINDYTADKIKEELTKGTPESWKTMKYSFVLGIFGGSGTIEVVFELLSVD